jgi:hypothetical protein
LQALTPIGGAQVNKASAKVGGEASGSLSWFSRWLPGDGRTSLLELSVAPGFLYDGSSSNYSFRNYTSTAETIGVEGKFWISSTLAIDASYKTSVSGDMSDTLNGVGRQISVTHDWLTLGLRNKTTFGTSRYPPSLVFGLDYYCYSLNVPSDSQSRENITSIGALLSVETELPSSSYHAWTLGFYVAPKLQHSESGGSAGFSSGGSTDANMIGFALGSRMRFDHTHSVYWKLSHMIEKDVFSGSASLRDPASGTTPVGVGVTNSFTGLQVGFTWSD